MPMLLYVLLLALSLIWGASFFFIKVLVESFGPISVAFLRCLFGLITILLILLIKREKIAFSQVPWVPVIAVGFLNTSIPWVLLAYSEMSISSSLASVLNASTPIWTLIIGIVIFKLRSNWYQFIGIMIGFVGILILVDIDYNNVFNSDSLAFVAMIIVTLCYGLSAQISKRYLQTLSVYQICAITLAIGTISSGSASVLFESPSFGLLLNLTIFWSLIGLGAIGSGIAYIIFFMLIQKGSAEFATLVTYLVPPFAILWGFLFLDETIELTLFIGLALILVGVFVSGRKKKINEEIQPDQFSVQG
jgi:drug/metabolite transporter (DMT)-like permease